MKLHASSPDSRSLDILGVALLVIVATAAVPLGANRPFVWGATGLGLALIVLAYVAVGRVRRIALPAWRWPAWVFAAFLLFAAVQLMPIGATLTAGGLAIESPTFSFAASDSLLSLLTWGQYGLLFAFAALLGRSERRGHWMVEAMFWIACMQAATGLISLFVLGDTLLGVAKAHYQGFATGTFVNRNTFATYVAAALPLGISLIATADPSGDPVRRRLLIGARAAGLAVLAAALVASGSRMGLVAGAVGTGLALLLALAKHGSGWRLAVAATAVCAMVLVVAFGAPLVQRIVDPGDDITNRLVLYAQVWAAILERPLLGYGGGSFAAVFPVFQHPPQPGELLWQRAHSTYLALWFEYGLVAGSIPILLVMTLWIRCLRRSVVFGRSASILAAATSVPVFAIHSALDFSLEVHAVALLMTCILALGAGRTWRDCP